LNVSNVRITKRAVDALEVTGRDYFIWDREISGFGVRVRATGAKSYVVQYRAGKGRGAPSRRMTLAPVGKVTPEEARDMARRVVGDVAHGDDPAAERTRKRRELTVREVSTRYLTEHVRPHNKPSWAKQIELLLNVHILPAFGTKRIGDVTRSDIKKWHSDMVSTPYGANRCLAVLRKMFTLAHKDWELIETNPAAGVKSFAEAKRERFFSNDELKAIGGWLASAEKGRSELPHFLLATRLLLLTGMRFGEVATLRWTDVDLQAGLVRLKDAKAGARSVALNSQAVAFLANAARHGPYVCGPGDANEPLTKGSYHAFWRRLLEGTGLRDARPHDFRHTVATLGAMAGGTAFTLRDLLGHKTVAITSGYVARTVDPIRALSETVGERISAAMKPEHASEAEDNVVLIGAKQG
jgi:integrase